MAIKHPEHHVNTLLVLISCQARRFSKAMRSPLIFCSASHSINVNKLFKLVVAKVQCTLLVFKTIHE